MQIDEHGAHIRKTDSKPVPVGFVEQFVQAVQSDRRRVEFHAQDVGRAFELHVGIMREPHVNNIDLLVLDGLTRLDHLLLSMS
jgi:hypothetical protein